MDLVEVEMVLVPAGESARETETQRQAQRPSERASQRREPSPTFDESDESDRGETDRETLERQADRGDRGRQREERPASPTFDESDESDGEDTAGDNDAEDDAPSESLSSQMRSRGRRRERETESEGGRERASRAASPTFDSDDDRDADTHTETQTHTGRQIERATPQQPQGGGVVSLFSTGAGRSVQLSAASVERGRQLMAASTDRGTDRGTAVKRPVSPSFDGDRETQSQRGTGGEMDLDPTAVLFAQAAERGRETQRGSERSLSQLTGGATGRKRTATEPQRDREWPVPSPPAAAQSGRERQRDGETPAGKPPAKQRRRTRVLGPERGTDAQKQPGKQRERQKFLSRRLQQGAEAVPLSSLCVSCAERDTETQRQTEIQRERLYTECARIVRNSGRHSGEPESQRSTHSESQRGSFFGSTANELLLDLVHAGADPKLIDESWVLNHSRWIMWKLAGYALHLSVPLSAPCDFSISSLREQLRYRYDVEKGQGKRSVLRKIADGDTGPSRPMVLCVASILPSAERDTLRETPAERGARLAVVSTPHTSLTRGRLVARDKADLGPGIRDTPPPACCSSQTCCSLD